MNRHFVNIYRDLGLIYRALLNFDDSGKHMLERKDFPKSLCNDTSRLCIYICFQKLDSLQIIHLIESFYDNL